MSDVRLRKIENADEGTYLDAVLDKDMHPIFNGLPEDVYAYLESNLLSLDHSVCVGRTMHLLTIPQYLEAI